MQQAGDLEPVGLADSDTPEGNITCPVSRCVPARLAATRGGGTEEALRLDEAGGSPAALTATRPCAAPPGFDAPSHGCTSAPIFLPQHGSKQARRLTIYPRSVLAFARLASLMQSGLCGPSNPTRSSPRLLWPLPHLTHSHLIA